MDNDLNCDSPGIGTHKGDEVIDEWFEKQNWDNLDCMIEHHEMTEKRWKILENAVRDRNQIFITSVRPARERIISWVNEILSQFTKSETIDKHPHFEKIVRQIMVVFDGDALYRYYCEDMKCEWHWLTRKFDYVINLWSPEDTGYDRIVDKMRSFGLYVKKEAPGHRRSRRNSTAFNYAKVFKTVDVNAELDKEDKFSTFLLQHVRPRESRSWI